MIRETAQKLTRKALEDYPITRGSDRHLIVAVWYLQNPKWNENAKDFILYRAIMPESITRHRRKLQEQGLFLPEDKITEARYEKFKQVRAVGVDAL